MVESADVVVIGAGIFGCCIAFNLARKGCEKAVVLDRAEIGSGTTARGRGGIRKQFSTASNIYLSKESFRILADFERLTGIAPKFTPDGYLFLATSEADLQVLRGDLKLQQSFGVDVRELSGNDVRDLVPELETSDILGANYCPSDGHVDNNLVLQGYVKTARGMGVDFREHTRVEGVKVDHGEVKEINSSDGSILTSRVVIAAGPQSGEVGAMCGVSIPITPRKRQVFVTEPLKPPPRLPLIVDMAQKLGLARESDGVLMGNDDDPANPNDLSVEWDMAPRVFESATRRMPLLANLRIRTAWAGFYEMTPDANPIIGPIFTVRGLYCAAGFSGHGFMHAPIVGEIIADLIIDGKSAHDISAFRWERFLEGDSSKERFVI